MKSLKDDIIETFGSMEAVANRFGYEVLYPVIDLMDQALKGEQPEKNEIQQPEFLVMIGELKNANHWLQILGEKPVYGYCIREGNAPIYPAVPKAWRSIGQALFVFTIHTEEAWRYDDGEYSLVLYFGDPTGDEEDYGYPDYPDKIFRLSPGSEEPVEIAI